MVAKIKADRAGRNQLSKLIRRTLAVIEDVQGQPLSEEQESQYVHALCAAAACDGDMGDVIDLLKPSSEMESNLEDSLNIALIAAAFTGKVCLIETLLTKGVRPVRGGSYPFSHPLHVAARQGHQDAVLLLLKYVDDTEINACCLHTLEAAATAGQDHIVRILLELEYEINYIARSQLGVLSAVKSGHIDLFKFLLERHKPSTSSLQSQALLTAAEYGHAEIVRMMLEAGADVDTRGIGGPSAIQLAASLGRADVVRLLLAAGADQTSKRVTCTFDDPLCRAASNGHEQVVQILLDAGEDVNGPSASDSPLYAAAGNEEIPMMRFLLERGADVHAHDCGAKAICTAAARGYELVVRLLVANGISPDGPRKINQSPMLSAMMGGQTHVIRTLTELGAKEVDPARTKYAEAFASGEYPKRMLFN